MGLKTNDPAVTINGFLAIDSIVVYRLTMGLPSDADDSNERPNGT